MLCTFVKGCKVHKHKHGEDDKVQASQGFGQSLVIPGQSAEAVEPAKAALDDPATWQQYKAFFRLRQLDDLKLNALVEGRLRGLFAGVPLIRKCYLDRLTRETWRPSRFPLSYYRQIASKTLSVLIVAGSGAPETT